MEIGTLVLHLLFNEKVKEAIATHILDKVFIGLYKKLMPSRIEKAFENALDKWSKNTEIRKYHYGRRVLTIQDFSEHIINGTESKSESEKELFKIFEEELKQDTETYILLLELRNRAVSNGVNKIISNIQNISNQLKDQTNILLEIKQHFSEINIGKRKFEAPENYIQRTCMVRIGNNDFISYHSNSQKYQVYSLLDFVKGNTDYKENKFTLIPQHFDLTLFISS